MKNTKGMSQEQIMVEGLRQVCIAKNEKWQQKKLLNATNRIVMAGLNMFPDGIKMVEGTDADLAELDFANI